MARKKDKTRAYKEGFTAGKLQQYDNQYVSGSTRYDDYERGYSDGVQAGGDS